MHLFQRMLQPSPGDMVRGAGGARALGSAPILNEWDPSAWEVPASQPSKPQLPGLGALLIKSLTER